MSPVVWLAVPADAKAIGVTQATEAIRLLSAAAVLRRRRASGCLAGLVQP